MDLHIIFAGHHDPKFSRDRKDDYNNSLSLSAIACHAEIVPAPAPCILATDSSILIMSAYVLIHWAFVTVCEGFQRKASIFIAAVMPVRRIHLFRHVNFNEEVSFKRKQWESMAQQQPAYQTE